LSLSHNKKGVKPAPGLLYGEYGEVGGERGDERGERPKKWGRVVVCSPDTNGVWALRDEKGRRRKRAFLYRKEDAADEW
jgi:hypothetical protein